MSGPVPTPSPSLVLRYGSPLVEDYGTHLTSVAFGAALDRLTLAVNELRSDSQAASREGRSRPARDGLATMRSVYRLRAPAVDAPGAQVAAHQPVGKRREEAGRLSPTRLSNPYRSVFGLVSPVAFVAAARITASATSRFAPTTAATAATATASRRAPLAIAVAAIHRTVRCRLKRKLVDRLPAVGALQVELSHVDHPTFSKAHSISFCGPRPSNINCSRRRPRGSTVPQSA
jgi:hypothetical protein